MTTAPATVLVVDDDERFRGVLCEFLERRGYLVRSAGAASEALALADSATPDLVLLDLHMPGDPTGGSIVRTLSATAPVIVITGANDIDTARRSLMDGACDFVTKPFKLERLMELIETALKRER